MQANLVEQWCRDCRTETLHRKAGAAIVRVCTVCEERQRRAHPDQASRERNR